MNALIAATLDNIDWHVKRRDMCAARARMARTPEAAEEHAAQAQYHEREITRLRRSDG